MLSSFSLLILLRALYSLKGSNVLHHLYMLLLFIGVLLLLYQGNLGGKLVYDFGLGVSR
ncbi:MAG: hypothetical protein Q9N34_02420 [Aquificota bacterium]|nr:hypothetical protein [Aquificota bacterium]